jgi:hypothetical protein
MLATLIRAAAKPVAAARRIRSGKGGRIMKRVLVFVIFGAFLLAIPAAQFVSGKAHVPLNKVQVCHKGRTLTIGKESLADHQGHGDGQLPACDFNNVFHTGDACPADQNGDGKADLAKPRRDADGVTPGCPAGTF